MREEMLLSLNDFLFYMSLVLGRKKTVPWEDIWKGISLVTVGSGQSWNADIIKTGALHCPSPVRCRNRADSKNSFCSSM